MLLHEALDEVYKVQPFTEMLQCFVTRNLACSLCVLNSGAE